MTRYDDELHDLAERIAQRDQLERRRKDLQQLLPQIEARVRDLKIALRNEEQDVTELNSATLAAFFQWITGRKEEALDREQAEARAAALKLDAARQELTACEQELKQIAKTLDKHEDDRRRYAELIALKRASVMAACPASAARILELEQQIRRLEPQRREIREAIAAGHEALTIAADVLKELRQAKDASRADLLTDSIVADAYKYRHVDRAQGKIPYLQRALRSFNTEMRHVRPLSPAEEPRGSDGLRFADFFYDGLVFDVAAHSRITKSIRSVETAADQVREAMSALARIRMATDREQQRLEEEIRRLVSEAK